MEFLIIFIVLLVAVLGVLISINNKLSALANHQQGAQPESDDYAYEIRAELSEIKGILEGIRYTTDIIENYQLPTVEDRKIIDRVRVDQEIDAMLDSRRS